MPSRRSARSGSMHYGFPETFFSKSMLPVSPLLGPLEFTRLQTASLPLPLKNLLSLLQLLSFYPCSPSVTKDSPHSCLPRYETKPLRHMFIVAKFKVGEILLKISSTPHIPCGRLFPLLIFPRSNTMAIFTSVSHTNLMHIPSWS